MVGPGKYDDLAMHCLTEAKAEAAVVIIFDGRKGSGMSGKEINYDFVSASPQQMKKLPAVLRALANDIENTPMSAFVVAN